jgi:hypothetical protein
VQLSITLDTKALAAAIGRMRGPEVVRIQARALETHANEARKATVREFVTHSIGKGIFGRNDAGAWKIITLSPAVVRGDNVALKITLKGLAALQETGGRIRPHIIKPKRAKLLAFAVAGAAGFGGDAVFAKIVHHPGAAVPKHESLKPAAAKVLVSAMQDIQRDLAALWEGKGAA